MEDHENLKNLIRSGDFMVSIDLSNAFISIPLHEDNKKYCSFEFKGNKYNFDVLLFSLISSPRIFTKIMSSSSHTSQNQLNRELKV